MSTIKEMNELNRTARRNKAQGGFTLIELMIVVAIVGILAAIAIPRYQDYVARSQVSEGLSLGSGLKTSLSEAFISTGEWPDDSGSQYDIASNAGRYVESLVYSIGDASEAVITVTMRNAEPTAGDIRGDSFEMYSVVEGTSIVGWPCRPGTDGIDLKYLPSSCQ